MGNVASASRLPRNASRFFPRLQGSLLFWPPILSFILALFLYNTGQIREILIRVVESKNTQCEPQLVLGFVAFACLTAMLFFSYLSACVVLRQTGIGYGSSLVYSSETELRQDYGIAWIRDVVALVSASLPILFIGGAFAAQAVIVEKDRLLVGQDVTSTSLPWAQLCATNSAELSPQLALASAQWTTLSLVFLVILFLVSRLRIVRGWRIAPRRTRTKRPLLLTLLAFLGLVLPIPLINWDASWNEGLFNAIGPLMTLGLMLTSTAWLLFVIGEISRRSGFPIFLVLIVVVFVFGLYQWSSSTQVPPDAELKDPVADTKISSAFAADFKTWLRSRTDKDPLPASGGNAATRRPYPVFIIAAPGGGIYAASFIASVVSRIEQHCPGFSQHVFAISAVSGGAIGSSIINAVTRSDKPLKHVVCLDPVPPHDPQVAFVKEMLSDDHLSPTMASTIPDVITKLALILGYEVERRLSSDARPIPLAGRAEALEESFVEAVGRACKNVEGHERLAICANPDRDGPFRESFRKHWRTNGVAPALVLNTTWAETGQRIAFAPFPLADIGDDMLRSMDELRGSSHDENLIQAAVASARFPAVLPAMIYNNSNPQLWWNFVDGGYADASGTTTALELYKAIETIEKESDIVFDLKLLLLTESSASAEMRPGAGLSHAISPITTLLTIRDQIGRRAVARATSALPPVKIEPGATGTVPLDCQKTGERWRMRQILLDSSTVRLPLGWMLSRHTADMIDRLVNSPDNVKYPAGSHGEKVAQQNKETFLLIKESLTGTCRQDAPFGR